MSAVVCGKCINASIVCVAVLRGVEETGGCSTACVYLGSECRDNTDGQIHHWLKNSTVKLHCLLWQK